MRAMILAAGRGERLRPITDQLPKPLVEVHGQPLIFHHLQALAQAGFTQVVVNLGHLGDVLQTALGDGSQWGLTIHYSREPADALETGGGIAQALPLLGKSPFLVINGDIYTDIPLEPLRALKCDWAHLLLVPVPEHRPHGDFLLRHGRIHNPKPDELELAHTFSGIAVYHPRFFEGCEQGRWSVVPRLRETVATRLVTGSFHSDDWTDVGTPERLAALQNVQN